MKTLLSLYDYSGAWAEPFYAAGWNVIQLDLKHGFDINNLESAETVLEEYGFEADGIIAAPPCTEFTVSGAQYWKAKDADGRTAAAIQLVRQVQRLADLFQPTDPDYDGSFFWAMENPVGRIGKIFPELGEPYYFDPYHFAGYRNPTPEDLIRLEKIRAKHGIGVTAQESAFVVEMEAYTKKTGLWGNFNRNLERKIIQPAKAAPQGSFTQRLGGKSAKTKEARSNTPTGFAEAFFQANHNWTGWTEKAFQEE